MIIIAFFFVVSFIFASFVEYWIHRLMHFSPLFGKRHREHHRKNEGQGVLWEFLDYLKGSFLLMLVMFFVSLPTGIGWFLGSLTYAIFAAYAHQIQHDNPQLCFWMKMPIHYVHHKYNQWEHNFGLGVDWWDHIFGTYHFTQNLTDKDNAVELSSWQIRWY